jgi:hypothetical protein
VSVRDPSYTDIVLRTSAVLPIDKTFGDGKLTIFKYVSTFIPIAGNGPSLLVTFDDATSADVPTTYNYFVKSQVNYEMTLVGHRSYNITGYPVYWTFRQIKVNGEPVPLDQLSDVNTFVYAQGLNPEDNVEVLWLANEHYKSAGWKEDSFTEGWRTHPLYPGTISPNIATDGSILRLSWNFTGESGKYQYFYYIKSLNVSTDSYQHALVRWRSTGPIGVVAVAYQGSESTQVEVVPYGSQSSEWTESIVTLEPSRQLAYVMVGITNLKNRNMTGLHELEIDYILISSPQE